MFETHTDPGGLPLAEAAPTEEIYLTVSSALETERRRLLADPQEPVPDLSPVHQAELWLEWVASCGLPRAQHAEPASTREHRRRCA